MKPRKLAKIRLTLYFPILFVVFLGLIFILPKVPLISTYLTLFTVNSILLGFYLGPLLAGSKARIEELTKLIRQESTVFYKIMLEAEDISSDLRDNINNRLRAYLRRKDQNIRVDAAEKEYEDLLRYCIAHKKDSQVRPILDQLINNEQNRTQIAMQLRNKVYSHEWIVVIVLYLISVAFILSFDYGNSLVIKMTAAALGSALTLSLFILWKLTTLTHKKAQQIWDPFLKLLATDFQQID